MVLTLTAHGFLNIYCARQHNPRPLRRGEVKGGMMFRKRKDMATVHVCQNGDVVIDRGMGYARRFDKVYPSDHQRIEKLFQQKSHVKKLTNAWKAQLRFYWFRYDRKDPRRGYPEFYP
jgi:hypothetical protein